MGEISGNITLRKPIRKCRKISRIE